MGWVQAAASPTGWTSAVLPSLSLLTFLHLLLVSSCLSLGAAAGGGGVGREGGECLSGKQWYVCVCERVCVYVCARNLGRGRYDEASVLSRWISWMTLSGLFSCLWAHSQLSLLSSSPSSSFSPNLHVIPSVSVPILVCFDFFPFFFIQHTSLKLLSSFPGSRTHTHLHQRWDWNAKNGLIMSF